MNAGTRRLMVLAGALFATGVALFIPRIAWSHCDTLDGPVVTAARIALEKSDVTPVLKWVKKEHEAEVREAFKKSLAVRAKGAEARDLADMYFFETVVRIHRAGEGAPYSGLKPAGTSPEPAVTASDKALDGGSADDLVKMVTDAVAAGIRERFARASETRKHANESVEAGREAVEAYVQFVHYVERLYTDAVAKHVHHDEAEEAAPEHEHPRHE